MWCETTQNYYSYQECTVMNQKVEGRKDDWHVLQWWYVIFSNSKNYTEVHFFTNAVGVVHHAVFFCSFVLTHLLSHLCLLLIIFAACLSCRPALFFFTLFSALILEKWGKGETIIILISIGLFIKVVHTYVYSGCFVFILFHISCAIFFCYSVLIMFDLRFLSLPFN